MHNLKKLLLFGICCALLSFPATANASDLTDTATAIEETVLVGTDSMVTDVADDMSGIPAEDLTISEETTEADMLVDDAAADTSEETVPNEGSETVEEVKEGLITENEKLYFYRDGQMVTDEIVTVNDKIYYFQKDGSAYTTTGTLVTVNGKTYTFNSKGQAYTYIVKKVNGTFYYFNRNGRLDKRPDQVIKVNDEYYGFDSAGNMYAGKVAVVNGARYYFTTKARALKSEKKQIGTKVYYFKSNGKAFSGWKRFDGKLYCFSDTKNYAVTGWRYRDSNSTWYYIDKNTLYATFKGNPLHKAYTRIKNSSSNSSYYIVVDTVACRTCIFKGSAGNWVPIKYWQCSPGAASTPTVKGYFTVGSRGYSFGGSNYTCYYWTQFYGGYLFHSVLYNRGTFNILDGRLGMNLSHGCVRLNIDNAKWINANIPSGTKVYTY